MTDYPKMTIIWLLYILSILRWLKYHMNSAFVYNINYLSYLALGEILPASILFYLDVYRSPLFWASRLSILQ